MFISDDIFLKKLQNDALQLFEKKGDDLFFSYLTTSRVLLYSMIMYGKTILTAEEKEEFGFIINVDECFDSVSRDEHLNTLLYLLVNYTHTAYDQIVEEAFGMALKMYEKGYKEQDKEAVLKAFKKQKTKVLQQYQEQLDEEKFFNLYEDLVADYMLTKKEKKQIKKDLEKKFSDLVIWDLKCIKKEINKDIENEQNRKKVQKIYDSFRK